MGKRKDRIHSKTLLNRIEYEYRESLNKVNENIYKVLKSFAENSGKDREKFDKNEIEKLIKTLTRYSKTLESWAKKKVQEIIKNFSYEDWQAWKKLSREIGKGLAYEISQTKTGEILKRYMDDNVKLITSLPLNAAERVHKIASKGLLEGRRAESLMKDILETYNVSKSRAKLIARTEISRISTGLIKARSERIGVDWFIWDSVGDYVTRYSHKMMDGVLCRWSDPPNPEALYPKKGVKPYGNYLPGATFNCRCYPDPLFDLNQISFPVRVHVNGKIIRMNKKQFLEMNRIKEAA